MTWFKSLRLATRAAIVVAVLIELTAFFFAGLPGLIGVSILAGLSSWYTRTVTGMWVTINAPGSTSLNRQRVGLTETLTGAGLVLAIIIMILIMRAYFSSQEPPKKKEGMPPDGSPVVATPHFNPNRLREEYGVLGPLANGWKASPLVNQDLGYRLTGKGGDGPPKCCLLNLDGFSGGTLTIGNPEMLIGESFLEIGDPESNSWRRVGSYEPRPIKGLSNGLLWIRSSGAGRGIYRHYSMSARITPPTEDEAIVIQASRKLSTKERSTWGAIPNPHTCNWTFVVRLTYPEGHQFEHQTLPDHLVANGATRLDIISLAGIYVFSSKDLILKGYSASEPLIVLGIITPDIADLSGVQVWGSLAIEPLK